MASPKRPSESTRSGICARGKTPGRPPARVQSDAKLRSRLARAIASSAAGAPTIRLAAVSTPSQCARSTASLTASCSPKSSAVTISPCRIRAAAARLSGSMGAQEAEEFDAFAQAALHHVPADQHLADDLPDLARAEIEALVEASMLWKISSLDRCG